MTLPATHVIRLPGIRGDRKWLALHRRHPRGDVFAVVGGPFLTEAEARELIP
ncbi:MAG TPA: hypothetical protein VJ850_09065 [Candidatus Limnocylindrales bacterium]|nr:hypothetical protein [Candidatus Limnocylindrales bacterium]